VKINYGNETTKEAKHLARMSLSELEIKEASYYHCDLYEEKLIKKTFTNFALYNY
jgi:hypothetical protein